MSPAPEPAQRTVDGGRYTLGPAIGSGGMATVHLARQTGPLGHSRVVALKRLRKELARDPEFVSMLLDEARLTTRVRHANVVPLLDVVAEDGELMLVLDYVPGVPLSWLASAARNSGVSLPTPVVVAIGIDLLDGLHAIHGAADDRGQPLEIIHRDVSPQNVLVGEDGVARILDLGVAKAAHRAQTTRSGELKGKLCYMAPEQVELRELDCRTDVYAAAVVLWELCAGRRLHERETAAELLDAIAEGPAALSTSRSVDATTAAVEAELARALCYATKGRHATALELCRALQRACAPAPHWEVREWVARLGRPILEERADLARSLERGALPGTAASLLDLKVTREQPTQRSLETDDSQTGVTASVERGNKLRSPHPLALLALIALGFGLHALWRAASPGDSRMAAPPETRAQSLRASAPHAPAIAEPMAAAPKPSVPPAADVHTARPAASTVAPARARRLVTSRTAPPSSAPAPSVRPSDPCSPPYRIDGSGVRVYKEECL